MILNVRAVGADGKSPCRRVNGRGFNMRVVGLGEQVMHKLPIKGPAKLARCNAAGNSEHATYIGFSKTNCEHTSIRVGDAIVTSRHVVRLPEEQR